MTTTPVLSRESTSTTTSTDEATSTESGRVSHIVHEGDHFPPVDQESGRVFIPSGDSVVDSFVHQTPVTALCGHVLVPENDPKKYPICQACNDIARERWGKGF